MRLAFGKAAEDADEDLPTVNLALRETGHAELPPKLTVHGLLYFTQLDPANEDTYEKNEKAFEARLNAAEKGWAAELATIKGKPVVAWHTSWRYFAEYNRMNIVAFMEPKPGVPPSPSHLYEVIQAVKRTGAKAIVMEPFYDRKVADLVSKQTGIKVLILPPSVGGVKGIDDYIQLMQYDMAQLAAALK